MFSLTRNLMIIPAASLLLWGCRHDKDLSVTPPVYSLRSVSTPEPTAEQSPASSPSNSGSREMEGMIDERSPQTFLGPIRIVANIQTGLSFYRDDYRVAWLEDEPGKRPETEPVPSALFFTYPLWRDERNEWAASGNFREEHLPESFLEDFWSGRLSASYCHRFNHDLIGGGSLTIASTAEQPSHFFQEMTTAVSAVLQVPQGEHNVWLYTLSQSSNRDQPQSKVEFTWQPSELLRAKIGLLVPIVECPWDDLSLDVSILLLRTNQPEENHRMFQLHWPSGGLGGKPCGW